MHEKDFALELGREGETLGKIKKCMLWSAALTFFVVSGVCATQTVSWSNAKKQAADLVYYDHPRTFYCGCVTESDDNDNGSVTVSHADCGYKVDQRYRKLANTLEWEHIVPAATMPVRLFDCWRNGDREECEKSDPLAQEMLFDLHNLAPAIGQVNRLRLDDRYEDLAKDTSDFGQCEIEDTKWHFEPPDCHKGDAARVWFYMADRYGVVIPPLEQIMFEKWSRLDPVSPWEAERNRRIAENTGVSNQFVNGIEPQQEGSCSWE